jgi:hypothetical protein
MVDQVFKEGHIMGQPCAQYEMFSGRHSHCGALGMLTWTIGIMESSHARAVVVAESAWFLFVVGVNTFDVEDVTRSFAIYDLYVAG